jgi:polyhydroxyalkanoate synthesis regulator phasin
MGWSTGNLIFDPLAETIMSGVNKGDLDIENARIIIERLIEQLQERDWDTEDESLEKFKHIPWIVEAFAHTGITLEDDEDENSIL